MDKEIAPAEPEVLWRSAEGDPLYRVTLEGKLEFKPSAFPLRGDSRWEVVERNQSPMERELIRRLVAERDELQKLDDHNDELERRGQVLLEGRDRGASLFRVEASADGLLAHYSEAKRRLDELEGRLAALEKEDTDRAMLAGRVQELDENLAREVARVSDLESVARVRHQYIDHQVATLRSMVEAQESILRRLDADVALLRDAACPPQGAPPEEATGRVQWWGGTAPGGIAWERGSNRMVDSEERCVLDLSDYDNLSPKDHDLLEKLADLWSAWGPEGYLRELLLSAPSMDAAHNIEWYHQLRSELLAKPWKEGV